MKAEAFITALALACIASGGCTVSRFASTNPTGGQSTITSYTVAWPWTDTSKALAKAQLYSATNRATVNLTGLSETQVGNTNTEAFLLQVINVAVQAAVKGAVP